MAGLQLKKAEGGLMKCGAFSLVEVLVAAAVFAIAFTAIFVASSQCMAVAKSSRNMSLASQVLQERMDSLRSGSGTMLFSGSSTITSGSLQTLVANPTYSGTSSFLLTGTETINISTTGSSAAIMSVTRPVLSGSAVVLTSGTAGSPVRVDLTITWTEQSGGDSRTLSRSMSTVISNTN